MGMQQVTIRSPYASESVLQASFHGRHSLLQPFSTSALLNRDPQPVAGWPGGHLQRSVYKRLSEVPVHTSRVLCQRVSHGVQKPQLTRALLNSYFDLLRIDVWFHVYRKLFHGQCLISRQCFIPTEAPVGKNSPNVRQNLNNSRNIISNRKQLGRLLSPGKGITTPRECITSNPW